MLELFAWLVCLGRDLAAKGVLGVDDEGVARIQGHDGFGVRAIHEVMCALLSVGASMISSGFSGRYPALRHD